MPDTVVEIGAMRVYLLSRPEFLGLPEELGVPRADQLQGGDSAQIIETAGRTCYDSFGKGRSSPEYHKHIIEVGHGSVLAHVTYTFFITGVSRGLTHELVRHGIGTAISQRSTRYVDESDSPWIKHPLFLDYVDKSGDQELEVSWNDVMAKARRVYDNIVTKLQKHLEDRGASSLNARKQARGAARGILGNALETELVWSANVRALRWIISQRASDAADAEIRRLGMGLFRLMSVELPQYFGDFLIEPATDGLGETAVVTNGHL